MVRLIAIADACELVTDGTHYTPKDLGHGIPFLTVKDITDSSLDLKNCSFISEEDFKIADSANSAPKPGDVLFSKDGTVGKVHVVSSTKPFAVLSSIAILRPNSKIVHAQYLGHALRFPITLDEAQKRKTGSAIRRIILSDLKNVRLPLPPLPEQRRITAILDQADALRSKRRQTLTQLDEMARAIFVDMFGDPASNPKIWPKKRVDHLCRLVNGRAFKPHEWETNGVPIIRIQNLNDHAKPFNYTTQSLPEKFKVRAGDVLFSWSGTPGTSFGCFRWMRSEGWLNQHIFKVHILPAMDSEFFLQQMNLRLDELIIKAHGGVGLQHVTKPMIDELQFICPPLGIQQKFREAIGKLEQIKIRTQTSIHELDTLFASLQHRAFRGEL